MDPVKEGSHPPGFPRRIAVIPISSSRSGSSNARWDDVSGLDEQQKRHLNKLQTRGVLWKHPVDNSRSLVFRLSHGGEVDSDGNCLFTSSMKAMGLNLTVKELRRRTVSRFLKDFGSLSDEERVRIKSVIRNMYSPDLKSGWGVNVVQEVKLLARKEDREGLYLAIDELIQLGMQRELAAESIFKERCLYINNGSTWAKYMSVCGCPEDEYNIISLLYTEAGLLSVDENRNGRAAAFGDDIAIECLATEFQREIFVVQVHGSDASVKEENCAFFFPHRPRNEIRQPPFFLFMKGSGWCGGGGDHYEPLVAQQYPFSSQEDVALVL